jgi:Skp family chaperone for outer membrane proteins
MAKSQATFMKKQLEKNRQKKKEHKEQRKLERQQNSTDGSLDSMMAYVNEFGEITSTPPEKNPAPKPDHLKAS